MVPIFAAVADRLSARAPVGVIVGIGCLLFGLGTALIALSVDTTPDFATEMLPGWLIGGIGVGFALPSILSSATADLPPHQAATGSAVVSMSRQIGMSLGVSLFVAVIGTAVHYDDVHDAFVSAWWVLTGIAAVGAVSALDMTPRASR